MGLRQKVFVFGAFLTLPLVYFMYSRGVSTMDGRDVSTVDLHHARAIAIPIAQTAKPIIRYPRYAVSLSRNCSEMFCLEFLTSDDKRAFDGCITYTEVKKEVGSCKFINQTLRLPVALASYQGSGNTWIRGLLERATGICTGSVFCDSTLRTHGFIGENIRSGAVLVTKTHYPAVVEGVIRVSTVGTEDNEVDPVTLDPTTAVTITDGLGTSYEVKKIQKNLIVYHVARGRKPAHKSRHRRSVTEGIGEDPTFYTIEGIKDNPWTLYRPSTDSNPLWGAVIVVVRNPFHALVAEYNRRRNSKSNNSHIDSLERDSFGNDKKWNCFVYEQAPKWKAVIEYYFVNDLARDKLCVMYENLKNDSLSEVMRMLEFLNFDYSESELESRLQQPYFSFQRNHTEDFDHFTPMQRNYVNFIIESTMETLKDSEFAGQIPLEEYLKYT